MSAVMEINRTTRDFSEPLQELLTKSGCNEKWCRFYFEIAHALQPETLKD